MTTRSLSLFYAHVVVSLMPVGCYNKPAHNSLARLQQTLARPINVKSLATEVRTLSILILIAALLCEHFDFEELRNQDGQYVPYISHICGLTDVAGVRDDLAAITPVRRSLSHACSID